MLNHEPVLLYRSFRQQHTWQRQEGIEIEENPNTRSIKVQIFKNPVTAVRVERIQTAGATAGPTQGAPRIWTSDEPLSKEQRGDADGLPIVAPPTPTIYILATAIRKEMEGSAYKPKKEKAQTMVEAEYGGCGCCLQERRKGKKVERRLGQKRSIICIHHQYHFK